MKDIIHKNYSGSTVNITNPEGNEYKIGDIAHQLALSNRFRGTTANPVSVAQHSISCALSVESDPVFAQVALMHDAAEAYLFDMPYLMKGLFPEFELIHDRLLMDIFNFFDLEWWMYDSNMMRQLDQDVGIAEMKSEMFYDTSDLPDPPSYVKLMAQIAPPKMADLFVKIWTGLRNDKI